MNPIYHHLSATKRDFCAVCPNDPTITCAGCDNIKYCSAACQQSDAPQHNTLCSTFKDFQERPSSKHYRAIYFPSDEPKPRFIWLRMDGEPGVQVVDKDDLAQYVFGSRSRGDEIDHHWDSEPRELKTSMRIEHDKKFIANNQPHNMCFGAMIDPQSAVGRRGGHVGHVYSYRYSDEEEAWNSLDLDTTSLGPLLEYIEFITLY